MLLGNVTSSIMGNIIDNLLTLPLSVQLAMVFVFSALVGSFLNVVIYRLPIMLERDWQAQAREILELPAEKVWANDSRIGKYSCD